MGFLERTYPELWKKYQRLYRGAYAPDTYSKEVRGIVKLLQQKYGVRKREENETPGEIVSPGVYEQGSLKY